MEPFSDQEFLEACAEIDEQDVEGWEYFTESHNVTIYRKYDEVSGLYSYKVYGSMDNISCETCVDVYLDHKYRKVWDSYAKELEKVGDDGLYWQVNFPFPMSNRDYTFTRQMREIEHNGRKVWVIIARGTELEDHPPRKGVIRVNEYLQKMVITSDGAGGTKAFMHYFDNPGGMIPCWLINWAAKTGVPAFLGDMEKACRGYPKYLEKLSKS